MFTEVFCFMQFLAHGLVVNYQINTTVMKNIILSISLAFIAFSSKATFLYYSNLSISVSQMGTYLFEVNGMNYTPQNNTVYIQNVNYGVEQVSIYSYQTNMYGQAVWVPVFTGTIRVPANASVNATWNPWNGMVVRVSPFSMNYPNYPNNPSYPNYPNNPSYPNYPNYPSYPNYPNNPNYPNYPNNPNYPTTPNYPSNPTTNTNPNYVQGMNPSTFQGLVQQISATSFESNKLDIAKTAIKSNRISVAQLQQLLTLFSYDSNRLDLAKFAHPYCVDQNNYFMLSKSFDFESNANDLLKSFQ